MNPRDLLDLTPAEEREFARMDKAMHEARAWMDEPALRLLPHPVRAAAVPVLAPNITLATICEERHNQAARGMLSRRLSTVDLFLELERLNDRRVHVFHALQSGVAEQSGGFGNGAAGATVQAMRFRLSGGRIYSFTDELVSLLHKTKLGTDIPVSELRLPDANIYIELGTRAEPFMLLHHPESGDHALEGAYISSVVDAAGEECLEVTMTGSPCGRDDLTDDVIEWACMRAAGQMSVSDALAEAFTRTVTIEGEVASPHDLAVVTGRAREALPKLELIAKCILFLGLPDAVKRTVLDGTDARNAVARAQSGARKRKASKVAARSYDRVVVTAPPAPEMSPETIADRAAGTKSFHWREGHLRHQRHGPGLSLTKVIWIRPVPIRLDLLSSTA